MDPAQISAGLPVIAPSRSFAISFVGAAPKNRPYSRLNWDELKYPTWRHAVPASIILDTMSRLASCGRSTHKLQHQGCLQFLRGGGGVRFTLPASDSLEFEETSEAVPEAAGVVLGGWMKDDAQGLIRKAYIAAGLEPLTFHELRHTYASALINRGVPLVSQRIRTKTPDSLDVIV